MSKRTAHRPAADIVRDLRNFADDDAIENDYGARNVMRAHALDVSANQIEAGPWDPSEGV